MIENTYKSDAKPPGTSKIYYGPEMTIGTKSATVVKNHGVIYYRKFTTATEQYIGPWWHLKIFEVFLAEKKNSQGRRSKSSLDWPPGLGFKDVGLGKD